MDFDTVAKGIDWARAKTKGGGVLKCDICFTDIEEEDIEKTTNVVMRNKALTLCDACFSKQGADIILSSLSKKALEEGSSSSISRDS